MEVVSLISKDVQLQPLEGYIVAFCELLQVVSNVCFPFHTSKEIQDMQSPGRLVTLVPSFPGEIACCFGSRLVSVCGLVARGCRSTVLLLSLGARVPVMFW